MTARPRCGRRAARKAQSRRGEIGITLIEILVVGAISAVVTALAGTTLFQFNKLSRLQYDALTLDHQLQKANALLGHDVIAATEGTVAGSALTLTVPVHTFGLADDPTPLTITYSIESDTLVRDDGSGSLTVARYLDDVDFGDDGALATTVDVTITVTVREESRTDNWTLSRRPSS